MKNLFLDDIRSPKQAYYETFDDIYIKQEWHVVRTYESFCEYIENYYNEFRALPQIISFDHDLDDEHYHFLTGEIPYDTFKILTGWHCATWLKELCEKEELDFPKILCHSLNPQGKVNILGCFK